jgi:hypothetical protein
VEQPYPHPHSPCPQLSPQPHRPYMHQAHTFSLSTSRKALPGVGAVQKCDAM